MLVRQKTTFGSASRPTIYGEGGDSPTLSPKLRGSKSTPNLSRSKTSPAIQRGPTPAEARAAAVDDAIRKMHAKYATEASLTPMYMSAIRSGPDLVATTNRKAPDYSGFALFAPSPLLSTTPSRSSAQWPPRLNTAPTSPRRRGTSRQQSRQGQRYLSPSRGSARGGGDGAGEADNGTWTPAMLKPLRVDVMRKDLQSRAGAPSAQLPKALEQAADGFDDRLRKLQQRAHQVEQLVRSEPAHPDCLAGFSTTLQEMARSRFYVREKLDVTTRIQGKAKALSRWRLETSIWAPRVQWCDARSFYETDACTTKMLQADWKRAVQVTLGSYIMRHDDDTGSEAEAEVDEVYEILWTYRRFIYALFDFYACIGTSDDIVSIQFNAFAQFTEDFELPDKRSDYCKKKDFDGCFIAADASNVSHKIVEKYKTKKKLNRREWIQVLVQIAIMRYVMPGVIADVSTAVQALFIEYLLPNADPTVAQPSDATRELLCYNEEVDNVLRRHEDALRMLYTRTTALAGASISGGLANKLASISNWRAFLSQVGLVGLDCNEREATLCFVRSRMNIVDEQNDKSRIKWTHLSFEDFCEALCRVAVIKALPTDEEVEAAGCSNAAQYLLNLEERDLAAYNRFLMERRRSSAKIQDLQPVARCLEHLVHMIIVTAQGGLARDEKNGFALTEKQVNYTLREVRS